MGIRKFLSDDRGLAVTEFALLAPVFMIAMFGLIETSRVLWTKQTLDEVAYATARCTAVSASCDGLANLRSFATTRGAGYGVTIPTNNVTMTDNTTCNGLPNSKQVDITMTFTSVMDGFVPSFPVTLQARGCFPVLS